MKVCWGPGGEPRPRWWACGQGWPAPYFGFKKAFTEKMLESRYDEDAQDELREAGCTVTPQED